MIIDLETLRHEVVGLERPETKFEDWRGHQLDRNLLTLLQKKRQKANCVWCGREGQKGAKL
jgi:hypothetical protein